MHRMLVLILCILAVASVASAQVSDYAPPATVVEGSGTAAAAAMQSLHATLRAFEAKQAVPKPLPQSHNVDLWLGGIQYKSRMSPQWTDEVTGRRLRLATGFGRRDVVVEPSRTFGGASSPSWRVRPFREYGFGESQVVRVSPSGLDFGVQEACIPSLMTVEFSYRADTLDDGGVANDDSTSPTNSLTEQLPLEIHGIHIQDKQFLLAEVFAPITLSPGSVHTFHVLFLPHRHSSTTIHSAMTFQTSLGDVPYPLRGSGVPNRYRVSEFKASIAAGVQFDPTIDLYNPHPQMLRVTEVFTTEGFLHVELPKEHHIALDFINTGHTTVLIQGVSLQSPDSHISVIIQGSHAVAPMSRVQHGMVVSFGSTADAGTFTGNLIVHTNDTSGSGPDIWLNYTATKVNGGIAFAPEDVQFTSCGGAGRGLVLTNHFDTPVAIEMVQLVHPWLFALHNFTGNATADAGASWPPIYFDCVVLINDIPVTSPVRTHTTSHLLVQTNVSRHVVPLVLSSNRLTLETKHRRWQAVVVQEEDVNSSTSLPRRGFRLDLGNVSLSRHVAVNLTNFNPNTIAIHSIVPHLPSVEVYLERPTPHLAASVIAYEWVSAAPPTEGDDDDDGITTCDNVTSTCRRPSNSSHFDAPLSSTSTNSASIPPGFALPMILHITPASTPLIDVLAYTISTAYETIDVYLSYAPVQGTIAPTRRQLRTTSPLYPGRAEVVPLQVDSSFNFAVPITAIRVSDRRVQVLSQAAELKPNATTVVAQLIVSPAYAFGCASADKFADCMLPAPIGSGVVGGGGTTTRRTRSLSTFGQPVTQTDVDAHFQRLERFSHLQGDDSIVEVKVVVYTDLVAVAPVIVRMSLARPRLLVAIARTEPASTTSRTTRIGTSDDRNDIDVPLTHVGHVTKVWLSVTNPSNVTIDVGLALLASPPSYSSEQEEFNKKEGSGGRRIGGSGGFYACPSHSKQRVTATTASSCKDAWTSAVTAAAASTLSSSPPAREPVAAFFLSATHKPRSLAPGETVTLGPILFAPTAAIEFVGRVYLRNTLSHIEPIVVRGMGGQGHVVVRNNVVLESRADSYVTMLLENDGNVPLVVFGWSCPRCRVCDDVDDDASSGFCVQVAEDLIPLEVAPHGPPLALNVSFVSACSFSVERESMVWRTSAGDVAVPLHGIVTDLDQCLGTTRMSYLYRGFRWLVWTLFALVASQIMHYTVQIVWIDWHSPPADTSFGWSPPPHIDSNHLRPPPPLSSMSSFPLDPVDDSLLADQLQAIETQVLDSFTFAPIRSPAVQRLLDQRKAVAAALKDAPLKKKSKMKKPVAPPLSSPIVKEATEEGDAKLVLEATDDADRVQLAASGGEVMSHPKTSVTVKVAKDDADMSTLLESAPPLVPNNCETGTAHDNETTYVQGGWAKDGQVQPDMDTNRRDTAVVAHGGLGNAAVFPSTSQRVVGWVAELSMQDGDGGQDENEGGFAVTAIDTTTTSDEDNNNVLELDQDDHFGDYVAKERDVGGMEHAPRFDADGDDVIAVGGDEDDVIEDGDRMDSVDLSVDTTSSSSSSRTDPHDDDDVILDNDDVIAALDPFPRWSTNDSAFVECMNRHNTIAMDEIDQLMQEIHNETQAVVPREHALDGATSWTLSPDPHRHRPSASFPPPPGFSAADADPLAVSQAYSEMRLLHPPCPSWDTNAFRAPPMPPSYLPGRHHRPGFIGSHRQPPTTTPVESPHAYQECPPQQSMVRSLATRKVAVDSFRAESLHSESSSPMLPDGQFSFW
ncbi:hypothetical protein B5M09_005082 [Aphanomyces astaci]|uniref:TMEM131 second Ig-like domain-containing protein n=1 Tax=Aphanomyces astaci TaxID=112090 RepID=A0A3R7XUJ7_APHAT|nr:hypothetical protein B5M09_005082 [Aphanomyces astaci]